MHGEANDRTPARIAPGYVTMSAFIATVASFRLRSGGNPRTHEGTLLLRHVRDVAERHRLALDCLSLDLRSNGLDTLRRIEHHPHGSRGEPRLRGLLRMTDRATLGDDVAHLCERHRLRSRRLNGSCRRRRGRGCLQLDR